MITPQFFAWDNFDSYTLGVINTWNKNVAWAAAGTFQDQNVLIAQDSFEEYDNGTVSTLDGGSGWAADAIFTVY